MIKRSKTHCSRGHSYAKYGRYTRARKDGKTGAGKCKKCAADSYADKSLPKGKRKVVKDPKFDQYAHQASTTNYIIALDRQLEHAMPWEQEGIKARIAAAAKGMS